ncbi:hypothetical protein SADUNF_Sadunf19G0035800 [Salix dunnii]|uniref:EF-hand domain-containing protein n=1 Tax=Salix dunnii TaxID=1413687 RepID=A0A835MCE6_9ROSI|nr:hypothetical protein SADUNF_Sadunf19G0035800 [Salix dunnii]
MEEIRRAAAAYYQNLPEEKKRYARFVFSEMDKNGDGKINLKEFMEYLNKDNNSALNNPSLFRALDKNNNGSLDFEEATVLYYIMQSGRALFCKSCNTFLTDVYFSCFHCFTSKDSTVSTYEICCDCFRGKKFTHHDDATFCDNYTLLSQGRSLALAAPPEKRNSVLKKIEMTVGVASVALRRAAGAFYEQLPEKEKKAARKAFKAMDKNRDGQISLREYMKYLKKKKVTDLTHQSIFRALDKDDNGSLDFEEAFLLFYIMQSGRGVFCKSCTTFMPGAYFSCSECFFRVDSESTYEICCDCYGGKRYTHHGGATFCDNYTLLRQSRSAMQEAPVTKRNKVLQNIEKPTRIVILVTGILSLIRDIGGHFHG